MPKDDRSVAYASDQPLEASARAGSFGAAVNRETSWVEFDRRVLELAGTPRLPLLHRVKLCGIVSSNLDEFFAVRVSRLVTQRRTSDVTPSPDGEAAAEALTALRAQVVRLQADQDALWQESLVPELAARGIRILSAREADLISPGDCARLVETHRLQPLEPVEVTPAAAFPRFRALTLGIVAETRHRSSLARRMVVIALPADVPRFLAVDASGERALVGTDLVVIRHLHAMLGAAPTRLCVFRVTRDALIPDPLEAGRPDAEWDIHTRREWGNPAVRLEVSADSSEPLVRELAMRMGLRGDQVYRSSAPLGLAAVRDTSMLTSIADRPPSCHPSPMPGPEDIFARLANGDVLVHHPYESFVQSVDAFTAAARDPDVSALKATVYRTGNPSGTLSTLMDAAGDGRRSVCVMELRARFDEAPNIAWTRTLRRAGVTVLHGPPGVKVHAKLALLERREQAGTRRYVHIGTGNYHASNASVYEDLSLFTADPVIAADAEALFDALAGGRCIPRFQKLVVGPWYLKDWLLDEIAKVAHGARAGLPSRITIKVNAVADPAVVDALRAAACAGVRVELVVRGICTLCPGAAGASDRISVRSVLGPFLEHSRIFWFETGERTRLMIGSADLLPRNLDRRIEVLAPVEDPALQARVDEVRTALLADTVYAWQLDPDARWRRVAPVPGSPPVSAHDVLLARATVASAEPWAAAPAPSGSLLRLPHLGEVGQRRQDAPIRFSGLAEPELREDRVDVSFDSALGDVRCGCDRGVGATLGEEAEDLELSRRQHIARMSRAGR
jgi:polyphosphate kinase